MKSVRTFFKPFFKLSKGLSLLFLINFICIVGTLVLNSCAEDDNSINKSTVANADFKKAFELNTQKMGAIALFHNNNTGRRRTLSQNSQTTSDDQVTPVYVNFPNKPTEEMETSFHEVASIEDLSVLLQRADATVQYVPTSLNSEYVVNVPTEQVEESLDPLIVEAKKFLYTKGFTDGSIQQMIEDNHGTEEDLIPLVSVIVNSESTQLSQANKTVPNIFMATSSFAKPRNVQLSWSIIGGCALTAIGGDILYGIGGATAVWTTASIIGAFKVVAARALGPIGVAIAVVSFSYCLYSKTHPEDFQNKVESDDEGDSDSSDGSDGRGTFQIDTSRVVNLPEHEVDKPYRQL